MNLSTVIKRPLITEKTTKLTASNKYSFEVSLKSTKDAVAQAVIDLYKVDVLNVVTMIVPGKQKRIPGKRAAYSKSSKWKKAVVQIKEGQKIALFDLSEEKK
jgi:large subunit ribosomal protein L23